MKILLMLPYGGSYDWAIPDLGLGYIAGSLRKDGHDVSLFINQKEFSSQESFLKFIQEGKFDLIGLKILYSAVNVARDTIKLIRSVDPGVKFVLGGAHVSAEAGNIFNLIPEADYALRGEGEIGIVKFVRKFSISQLIDDNLADIPNLIWRRAGKIILNKEEVFNDLDSIPFPAWELMDPRRFPCAPFSNNSKRYPIAPIILTRGCPGNCTFCGAHLIQGKIIRSRSVENIMAEIRFLTSQFGVKEIHFYDSNCAHRHGPLREVCRRIIYEKINITWCAPNGIRVDSIDEELAGLMKKSGCFQVSVGIESGSPRILKQIKKGITPEMVKNAVSILRKAKIEVNGFFVFGFPGETLQEIDKTVSFALNLPLTSASFSILTPLPGTEIYHEVCNNNDLDIETSRSLSFMSYKNDLSGVPSQKLTEIQKRAYMQFFLRPGIIYYFIKNLNSIHKIKFLGKRIFRVLFR